MVNKKKELNDIDKKEIAFGVKIRLAHKRNDYIKELINGRYFLERTNMLAEQINSGKIKENIDGCTKTMGYMRAEYALQKMQAIISMRNSHFAKLDLIKDFNFTLKEINDIEKDYYDGKVVREDYDGSYNKGKKAEFVNSSKD